MGIRIHRNTWSSPLQLIDCWLPAEQERSTAPVSLSRAASRFIRAGWLQRKASNDAIAPAQASPQPSTASSRPVDTRMLRVAAHARSSGRADSRVRLSGRLADVCAELERLAAHDMPQQGRRG